ncbi:hypothetical protein SmJEL517_g01474 [Synchytrium microbalum]|uniref:Uncharacterized protein n=1 Tax=Synchytrium microbalum TaxID=1806994 RepID=A0A507C9H6_9FUNG|nr:uncharacterized protein SmJEL517_g01474 [Synchytrium microbalum]TPX36131.1 hypothetical protein SmJEL517_g01474 [Synchytrium microbalum]
MDWSNSDYESFKANSTTPEVFEWFKVKLGRAPEGSDIYRFAKGFFELGSYSRALCCLQAYITLPNPSPQARHLLGYCYLNLNELEKALREFKLCVKDNFHEDWQLVVELLLEIAQKQHSQSSEPQEY